MDVFLNSIKTNQNLLQYKSTSHKPTPIEKKLPQMKLLFCRRNRTRRILKGKLLEAPKLEKILGTRVRKHIAHRQRKLN